MKTHVLDACSGATSFLNASGKLQDRIPEGDEERHRPFVWALGYHLIRPSRDEVRERVGGAFGAAWEMDGQRFPPRVSDLPDGTVESWRDGMDAFGHPVMQARLGDLLWTVRAQPRPDLYARAAISAYVELAGDENWGVMERVVGLERAMEVARELGDEDVLRQLAETVIEHVHADLADPARTPGRSVSLLRALIDRRAPIEAEVINSLLVQAAERYDDDPYLSDSIGELRARLNGDEESRRQLRVEQVARWRAEAERAEGILRMHRLEQALDVARTHGLKEEADALRLELQEIGTDELGLEQISAETSLPTHEVEALVNSVADTENWRESLARFGVQGPPGGEDAEVTAVVEQQMEEFPLQYLMQKVVIAPTGGTALFRASDRDSHRRLAVAEHRTMAAQFWSHFAVLILRRVAERHGEPAHAELTDFFTTDFIAAESAERIARSLVLYWDGQYDEAAHVLVPRLETTIRELARQAGIPIIFEPVGDKPGGVRPLGTLLAALRPAFGDAAWHQYLTHLLSDVLGLNLRNSIAHGLRPQVSQAEAALLIHAACFLRLLGVQKRPSEPPSGAMASERSGDRAATGASRRYGRVPFRCR